MITHNEIKKGVAIIIDNEPFQVLNAYPTKTAQRRAVIVATVKSLISGNVIEKNFHQGDIFEEADITKFNAKFLYAHRGRYFFAKSENASERFEMTEEQIGSASKFLKQNQIVEAFVFNEKIISISLPIKVQLKVAEAPPGIKGERAQAGTKLITLETGVKLNVPLFITEGDIIEINTESGEYTKRASE